MNQLSPSVFVERIQQHRARAQTWAAKNPEAKFSAKMRGKELELSMLGEIGFNWWSDNNITAEWVKKQLDANKDVAFVRVLLNSPGGDYFEGVAIHNLLKRCSAKVIVEIIGEAASAASVIAMAGSEVQIHHGALLMVHEAWSCACGNAKDFESAATMLRAVNESAIDIYTERTGLPRADVAQMVEATTWIKAEDAVTQGWADKVLKAGAKPARTEDPITPPPPSGDESGTNARHSTKTLAAALSAAPPTLSQLL